MNGGRFRPVILPGVATLSVSYYASRIACLSLLFSAEDGDTANVRSE